jgi:hypothetical protein
MLGTEMVSFTLSSTISLMKEMLLIKNTYNKEK